MHKEILTKEQHDLLPILEKFSKQFGLVGGTAVALQIGHRRSIDFDLFSFEPFKNVALKEKFSRHTKLDQVLVNKKGEFTFITRGVKFTFYHFPYEITYSEHFGHFARMPDLLTLAAMKAFALGQRAKWKDYVDLYFILEKYHKLSAITETANALFGNEFNEKIFRTQLAYFKDIGYAEEVIYLPGFEVPEAKIKKALTEFSLQ